MREDERKSNRAARPQQGQAARGNQAKLTNQRLGECDVAYSSRFFSTAVKFDSIELL
jgi:hypothetical protein